jgi:hypothetical protein
MPFSQGWTLMVRRVQQRTRWPPGLSAGSSRSSRHDRIAAVPVGAAGADLGPVDLEGGDGLVHLGPSHVVLIRRRRHLFYLVAA